MNMHGASPQPILPAGNLGKRLRDWVWPPDGAEPSLDEAPVIRRIYAVILFGVVGFLICAALTPLAGGVISAGRVSVESNHKAVQHLEGGIVEKISVKDGDAVAAGQVLLSLKDIQSKGAFGAADERYWGLRALQARLEQESLMAGAVAWPADIVAAAGQSLAVQRQLALQRGAFTSRQRSLSAEQAIIRQQIAEEAQQKDAAAAQKKALESQLENVRSELKDMRGLLEKGLVTRPRVLQLERAAQSLEGDAVARGADVVRLSHAMQESQLRIGHLREERLSEVAAELDKVRAELAQVQGQRTATGDIFERTTVRAPISGVVVGLSVFTPGGVIKPGETLMQIVPQGEALIVESRIKPQDVDAVQVGQDAEVQFVAFARSAPRLKGAITYVSADAVVDAQGATFYQARVAIPPGELKRLGELKLVPGMPTETIVQTRKRTILGYLTSPVLEVFSRAFREE
jgi:HlyD family type I secretion membrane fusion protein